MLEIQEMLRKWEDGDEATRSLWSMMNGWVYDGFESTYSRMGVSFDKVYHESETYLLGKEIVENFLAAGADIKKLGPVLHALAWRGQNEMLNLLLSKGADIESRDVWGVAT